MSWLNVTKKEKKLINHFATRWERQEKTFLNLLKLTLFVNYRQSAVCRSAVFEQKFLVVNDHHWDLVLLHPSCLLTFILGGVPAAYVVSGTLHFRRQAGLLWASSNCCWKHTGKPLQYYFLSTFSTPPTPPSHHHPLTFFTCLFLCLSFYPLLCFFILLPFSMCQRSPPGIPIHYPS